MNVTAVPPAPAAAPRPAAGADAPAHKPLYDLQWKTVRNDPEYRSVMALSAHSDFSAATSALAVSRAAYEKHSSMGKISDRQAWERSASEAARGTGHLRDAAAVLEHLDPASSVPPRMLGDIKAVEAFVGRQQANPGVDPKFEFAAVERLRDSVQLGYDHLRDVHQVGADGAVREPLPHKQPPSFLQHALSGFGLLRPGHPRSY